MAQQIKAKKKHRFFWGRHTEKIQIKTTVHTLILFFFVFSKGCTIRQRKGKGKEKEKLKIKKKKKKKTKEKKSTPDIQCLKNSVRGGRGTMKNNFSHLLSIKNSQYIQTLDYP